MVGANVAMGIGRPTGAPGLQIKALEADRSGRHGQGAVGALHHRIGRSHGVTQVARQLKLAKNGLCFRASLRQRAHITIERDGRDRFAHDGSRNVERWGHIEERNAIGIGGCPLIQTGCG